MTAAAALVGVAVAVDLGAPAAATAATLTVTTTADAVAADGACALREAITAANLDAAPPGAGECAPGSAAGTDRIVLGPGVFALSRVGAGEDANATGDLDLRGAVAIVGAGAGATTIDARGIDRVLSVAAGATALIEGVTITGGAAPAGGRRRGPREGRAAASSTRAPSPSRACASPATPAAPAGRGRSRWARWSPTASTAPRRSPARAGRAAPAASRATAP